MYMFVHCCAGSIHAHVCALMYCMCICIHVHTCVYVFASLCVYLCMLVQKRGSLEDQEKEARMLVY